MNGRLVKLENRSITVSMSGKVFFFETDIADMDCLKWLLPYVMHSLYASHMVEGQEWVIEDIRVPAFLAPEKSGPVPDGGADA